MVARKKSAPRTDHNLFDHDDYQGVIGVDMSMTKTGIAVLEFQHPVLYLETTRVGADGKKDDSTLQRHTRLGNLQRDFEAAMPDSFGRRFLFVIEEPTYTSGGSGFDRAHAWWGMTGWAYRRGHTVLVVNNVHGKIYLIGRGSGTGANKIEKGELLAAAIKRYGEIADIPDDNVADAIAMLAIGARALGVPIEDSLPATHTRAVASVLTSNGVAPPRDPGF